MNDPFAGLSRAELASLLKKTLAFTIWLLKKHGRARFHPDLDPEDLVCRMIDDVYADKRHWDPERQTRLKFTTGCVKSYVSHFFESLASQVDSHDPEYFHDPAAFARNTEIPGETPVNGLIQDACEEHCCPEHLYALQELLTEITVKVESRYPQVAPLWALVRDEKLNLKSDVTEICERLNLDPTTGGADYQKFTRMRNKLAQVVDTCRGVELTSGGP